jgi:DNA-binding response OmpR family regulator
MGAAREIRRFSVMPSTATEGLIRGPVLIVDGDPSVRRILRLVLEGASFRCLSAATCAEAVELVAEYKPKLVLSEVQLEDASGYDLASTLSNSGWRPRIGLMSARPRPRPGIEDYFLSKPIEFDRLLQLLDSIELEPGW